MANRTKRTRPRTQNLLRALSAGESIYMACKRAGIGRQTYYEWREADPEFATQADGAIEDGTDILEDVLHSVAIGGNVKALLATLKARRRDKWGETQTVAHEGDITVRVVYEDHHA